MRYQIRPSRDVAKDGRTRRFIVWIQMRGRGISATVRSKSASAPEEDQFLGDRRNKLKLYNRLRLSHRGGVGNFNPSNRDVVERLQVLSVFENAGETAQFRLLGGTSVGHRTRTSATDPKLRAATARSQNQIRLNGLTVNEFSRATHSLRQPIRSTLFLQFDYKRFKILPCGNSFGSQATNPQFCLVNYWRRLNLQR